jgi:heme-degrading monooxygenase HmoA
MVRKQLARTDGVAGFSLVARPWKKEYLTLSVWETEEALDAFVKQQPHAALMASLSPALAPTTFVRWTIQGSDGRPAWSDAVRRLKGSP